MSSTTYIGTAKADQSYNNMYFSSSAMLNLVVYSVSATAVRKVDFFISHLGCARVVFALFSIFCFFHLWRNGFSCLLSCPTELRTTDTKAQNWLSNTPNHSKVLLQQVETHTKAGGTQNWDRTHYRLYAKLTWRK